jgi:putative ABC transport system permease protein
MIKHIFKLVWNRKRINFLIILEIFFSFLVLFGVVVVAVYYIDNYSRPLGFKYENIWNISIDLKQSTDDEWTPEQVLKTGQLLLALKELDEIESAAGAMYAPYSMGNTSSVLNLNGRRTPIKINEVTDGFKDVMSLNLVRGRWFSKEDDGLSWSPLVINQKLARELFGEEEPIGKNPFPPEYKVNTRIIGVVDDFRKDGEFSGLESYMFERKDMNNIKNRPPRNLLIKVAPGTTADFEEKLVSKLQQVARDWSFEVEPLAEMRETSFKLSLAPLAIVGIIAAFLIIMVGLGLTGVLWQNVTQRIKEIGLRRAKGATAGNIYTQILGELLMITTFGVVLGTAIVVQFPILDLIGSISTKVYIYSLIISQLLIYSLTIICGLYPSRLATRVQPAEALHYE